MTAPTEVDRPDLSCRACGDGLDTAAAVAWHATAALRAVEQALAELHGAVEQATEHLDALTALAVAVALRPTPSGAQPTSGVQR